MSGLGGHRHLAEEQPRQAGQRERDVESDSAEKKKKKRSRRRRRAQRRKREREDGNYRCNSAEDHAGKRTTQADETKKKKNRPR